jgi:hypothetical protein
MNYPLPHWLRETLERDKAAADMEAHVAEREIEKFVLKLAEADPADVVAEDQNIYRAADDDRPRPNKLMYAFGEDLRRHIQTLAQARTRAARATLALEIDTEAHDEA